MCVLLVGDTPCMVDNGGCSHLCLYRGGEDYVCACPSAMYEDHRPCSIGMNIAISILTYAELTGAHKLEKVGQVSPKQLHE